MTVASTTSGEIKGVETGGVIRFAGVPYAAPPTGSRRFRPPEPVAPWDGVRDASSFGPISLQNESPLNALFAEDPEPHDEDCLFLNIWTPALDGARRPVMVWIHGGGFVMGSGSTPLYQTTDFCTRGDVVLVSVNYRLGALGFLDLSSLDSSYAESGNVGILDQVAALRWVRDNIAGFGGDPDNVTIFGESAGGMSVATLMGTPAARGLFHKAIAQSGAASAATTPDQVASTALDFMRHAGVETVAELVRLPDRAILDAQGAMFIEAMANPEALAESGDPMGILPFRPVLDGEVLPRSLLDAIASGSAAGVALMAGTTLEEWRLFDLMEPQPVDDGVIRARFDALTGAGGKALDLYRSTRPGATNKELFVALMTDLVFRIPSIRLAEAQLSHAEVYKYLFTWPTPALGGVLGSCHALELPFVFGHSRDPRLAPFVGTEAPAHLQAAMQDAWMSFARNGSPSSELLPEWPCYDRERRPTMELGDELRLLGDPGAEERRYWEAAG
ncbi:MAG: Para-nitrobenzyl esterase [Acidimicrobiales bacterium]|nr:MAG: carboxylesterase/lipase family protein [Actinomycetota bacterium]MBV6507806.1 Para-nitrobenzyl esterase [Acidimicrobiales bacterium]RIK05963.1 MAG: carboxylesterase [Acidobacteriota bacterium]